MFNNGKISLIKWFIRIAITYQKASFRSTQARSHWINGTQKALTLFLIESIVSMQ